MKNIEVLAVYVADDSMFQGKIVRLHLREDYLKSVFTHLPFKWVEDPSQIEPVTIKSEHVFNEFQISVPLSYAELSSGGLNIPAIILSKIAKSPGVTLDDGQLTYICQWLTSNFSSIEQSNIFNGQPWSPKIDSPGMSRPKEVDRLPGLKEQVKHPVTGTMNQLESTIIDLNDRQKWTVNQIADWLDSLDLDLTIRTVEDKLDEPMKGSDDTQLLGPLWSSDEATMHFDVKDISPEIMKLLLGEDFNEQD